MDGYYGRYLYNNYIPRIMQSPWVLLYKMHYKNCVNVLGVATFQSDVLVVDVPVCRCFDQLTLQNALGLVMLYDDKHLVIIGLGYGLLDLTAANHNQCMQFMQMPYTLSLTELKWSGGWSTGTVGWLSASERGHNLEGWPAMNTKCLVPLPFLPDLILWSSENRSHGSPVLVPPETQ